MNETRQDDDSGAQSLAPLVGFALGALVGGGLALLFAPASGERTRRRIGATAQRWTNDARDTVDDARENVTEAATGLGEDVMAAVAAGRAAFEHDGAPRVQRAASRIAKAFDTPGGRGSR
jgi:gas vesicle protein